MKNKKVDLNKVAGGVKNTAYNISKVTNALAQQAASQGKKTTVRSSIKVEDGIRASFKSTGN